MKTFEVQTANGPLQIEGASFFVDGDGYLRIYSAAASSPPPPFIGTSGLLGTATGIGVMTEVGGMTLFVAAPGQWAYVRELKTQTASV